LKVEQESVAVMVWLRGNTEESRVDPWFFREREWWERRGGRGKRRRSPTKWDVILYCEATGHGKDEV
jgi:hypothetical protein